jgi:secreted PhoX family phosphatase
MRGAPSDRVIQPDPFVGLIGSCFYRYVPFPRDGRVPLAQTSGPLQALAIEGQIYNFARTTSNETEFCGACFDPNGQTLYVNQQGERGSLPDGPPEARAVTYAIYGPFNSRAGK